MQMRPALLNLLQKLNSARAPRIIMGLRVHDPIPDWVSHVAFVRGGRVYTGLKEDILTDHLEHVLSQSDPPSSTAAGHNLSLGKEKPRETLIDMKYVNVKYQTRHVCHSFCLCPTLGLT